MNFKFYFKESKLYDFLYFPGLVFSKERIEKSQGEYAGEEFYMKGYINLINRVEGKLKPYIKDIELFYDEQYTNSYDFVELITDIYTIFGYKDEKEYLNMLLDLDEKQIKSSIAYSILASNENNKEYSEEIMKKAENINKDQLISIIKELPVEPSTKWNLFMIIEEPMDHMRMYVNLMSSLLPIFEEIYYSYEDEVNNYGHYLVDFFNKNGSNGLKEISYSILDLDLIKDEENRVLISAIKQYALLVSSGSKNNYIVWGLKTEEYFKRMKEINENKVNERVHVFKNLGDKTRYEVLKLLAMGETSTKVIAKALGVSSATISYHISNLLQAKVIKPGITNDKYNYTVDYIFLEKIINELKEDMMFPN
ncbi:MAG: ArsR family transcriptional regulator [Tissierellia bacterium]|nr:ArsR family transcriptional regulator [Tissierellia bacterium]